MATLLNCSYRFRGMKVRTLYLYVLMAFPCREENNKIIMRAKWDRVSSCPGKLPKVSSIVHTKKGFKTMYCPVFLEV